MQGTISYILCICWTISKTPIHKLPPNGKQRLETDRWHSSIRVHCSSNAQQDSRPGLSHLKAWAFSTHWSSLRSSQFSKLFIQPLFSINHFHSGMTPLALMVLSPPSLSFTLPSDERHSQRGSQASQVCFDVSLTLDECFYSFFTWLRYLKGFQAPFSCVGVWTGVAFSGVVKGAIDECNLAQVYSVKVDLD